jgi:hypothetical protein
VLEATLLPANSNNSAIFHPETSMGFEDYYVLPDEADEDEHASKFDQYCARVASIPAKERPAAKDRVLERLTSDAELSSSSLAVALTLLIDLMWEKGCVHRLGFGDLSQRTGRDRSTVKRAVKLLTKRGHIFVESKKLTPKTNEINRYTFCHFFS